MGDLKSSNPILPNCKTTGVLSFSWGDPGAKIAAEKTSTLDGLQLHTVEPQRSSEIAIYSSHYTRHL